MAPHDLNLARREIHTNVDNKAEQMFTYRPLREGEIRLLTMDSQSEQSILSHAFLHLSLPYIALSYCWGGVGPTRPFELKGGWLNVTQNLYMALKELRRRSYAGQIWIDAICINQADNAEKSVQIPLMSSIYQKADKVLVWLGPQPEHSSLTENNLNELCKICVSTKRQAEQDSFTKVLESNSGTIPGRFSPFWGDLDRLLRSPWFRRLWTFPEALLANELSFWYGQQTMSTAFLQSIQEGLKRLRFVAFDVARRGSDLDRCLDMIGSVLSCRQQFAKGDIDLRDLIVVAKTREVSDLRDKVFAIHSLTTPTVKAHIPVDTTADTPTVFRGAAIAMLLYGRRALNLLSLSIGVPQCKRLGLPSWALDFCGRYHRYSLPEDPSGYETVSKVEIAEGNKDRLHVHGHRLGTVQAVSKSPTYIRRGDGTLHCDHEALEEWVIGCRRMLPKHSRTIKTSAEMLLLACILSCRQLDTDSARGTAQLTEEIAFRDLGRCLQDMIDFPHVLHYDSPTGAFAREVVNYSWDRCFFKTREQQFGLGPRCLQRGDEIVVLRGSPWPFAVRKIGISRSVCQLVGECWLHGIVLHDAAKLHSHKRDQVFVLE